MESVSLPEESKSSVENPPVGWIELIVVALAVALCDLTIFRGHGYAGYATLVVGLPLLLAFGSPTRRWNVGVLFTALLLIGAAVRLAWCGSGGAVFAGAVCLVAYAMSLAGLPPYITRILGFASQLIAAGHRGLNHYAGQLSQRTGWVPGRSAAVTYGFPLAALGVFGSIFIFANPDLVKSVGLQLEQLAMLLDGWLKRFSFWEIPFCIGAGWIVVGLLRPDTRQPEEWPEKSAPTPGPAPLFEAFRNTLLMVVALFAVYLVFEFRTLWFREFPKGFHYSGYAHQGAAWLTVALALATVLLSTIFQGQILQDERQGLLRKLAWVWSLQNLLLAAAVYHRLWIYVGFNGMTRMRTIGWLGITSVVIGFLLVVIRIARQKDFRWLLRRQLWTVCLAAYLYVVLPVDLWITRYNVSRILTGELAPSVQIAEHPLSDEGYLQLVALRDCADPAIQQGVKAMLARRYRDLLQEDQHEAQRHWTARQVAREALRQRLAAIPEVPALSPQAIDDRIEAYRKYAYQWY